MLGPHPFFRGGAGGELIKLAMVLNKAHGGGMLRWLMGLPADSLMELQKHTAEWLDEITPEDQP